MLKMLIFQRNIDGLEGSGGTQNHGFQLNVWNCVEFSESHGQTRAISEIPGFPRFHAIWGVQDISKPLIILKEYWCFQPGAASALQKRKNVDFNVILQKITDFNPN